MTECKNCEKLRERIRKLELDINALEFAHKNAVEFAKAVWAADTATIKGLTTSAVSDKFVRSAIKGEDNDA